MNTKLHIGTSGWSYKDWVGVFYPEGTKHPDFLKHYSQRFDTVEIDSTFYGIPRAATVQNWFNQTGDHFIFALKAPQIITHEKRLKDCTPEWNRFIETMQILKNKLGPIVLQFDYKFRFDEFRDHLYAFLKQHHNEVSLCVEIRNRDWHRPEFYDMLKSCNTALVLNDIYYMPRKVEITAGFTYIRLLGNRKQVADDFSHARINRQKDLDWWTEWINRFLEKDLDVYVYSNNRYEGHAPHTIAALMERLKTNS